MFSKLKSVVFNRIQENNRISQDGELPSNHLLVALLKFPYGRPPFLQCEEVLVSADHDVRPIIVPRDIACLPWNTGYAEAINAGKSQWNEDQCSLHRGTLIRSEARDSFRISGELTVGSLRQEQNAALTLPYTYFGTFDGHAGVGASLAAANQLHDILHQKLVDVLDHLIPPLDGVPVAHVEAKTKRGVALWINDKEVPLEPIIIGALEAAFFDMDQLIAKDRIKYKMKGGCTALVALFILGKLFVANAGDSRAVLVHDGTAIPMSYDHTPESERPRIRKLAALKPELLGEEFTHLDFFRRPFIKDLGKRILYRDAYMLGWGYKTVTSSDLKHPVVWGDGKRSRVMATIGVTRGFGDHDLTAVNSNLLIKPFLLSQPEVKIVDLSNKKLSEDDVLLMATDGLWDVISSERAAEIVMSSLSQFPASDRTQQKHRYTSAAQYLVMNARGKRVENSKNWRLSDGGPATIDDISVLVVPVAPYKAEYTTWKHDHDNIRSMYDGGAENTRYGKLSLMASPVGSRRNFASNVNPLTSVKISNSVATKVGVKDTSPIQRVLETHTEGLNRSLTEEATPTLSNSLHLIGPVPKLSFDFSNNVATGDSAPYDVWKNPISELAILSNNLEISGWVESVESSCKSVQAMIPGQIISGSGDGVVEALEVQEVILSGEEPQNGLLTWTSSDVAFIETENNFQETEPSNGLQRSVAGLSIYDSGDIPEVLEPDIVTTVTDTASAGEVNSQSEGSPKLSLAESDASIPFEFVPSSPS